MSSSYGRKIRLTIFGQSHGKAIGMTLEGLPAGKSIDMEALRRFLSRRAPGNNTWSTARKEADIPEFLSGISGERTCGTPLTAIIRNQDARPEAYDAFRYIPRPGHADYTAFAKYGDAWDSAGGGHLSGRLTAPLCIAGGILLQLLQEKNVCIMARIVQIGDIMDSSAFTSPVSDKAFPVVNDEAGEQMKDRILQMKAAGDSVGGVIECRVTGLPAGIGDPMFDGMENRIAAAVFGIPAVKGIEFGDGFEAAGMRGSEHNDAFTMINGTVQTESNHAGGILGGITDGMPLVFRTVFKPTPSIALPQKSVDLRSMEETELTISGRHDPCIVPRAVPVIEAAAALAVYDALAEDGKI